MDNINSNLGFLKVDMRSWSSSWIRFRNNNNPRITKMYGEKELSYRREYNTKYS